MSLAVLDCEQVADRILYKRCQTAGSHILPIHANMLTGVLLCLLWQENLNANHKWQKDGSWIFLICISSLFL